MMKLHSLLVKFQKERDILEFFPMALYSIGMIAKSGGSLEQGLKFVADRDFGRISVLFGHVLKVAHTHTLLDGITTIERESRSQFYQEAVMIMKQYAKNEASIGDRLVAIGNKMQREAIRLRKNHLIRVRAALIPQTIMLLCGIPFVIVIAALMLTSSFAMQSDNPILTRDDFFPIVVIWLLILTLGYLYLVRS